jgi:hypothetical protein
MLYADCKRLLVAIASTPINHGTLRQLAREYNIRPDTNDQVTMIARALLNGWEHERGTTP